MNAIFFTSATARTVDPEYLRALALAEDLCLVLPFVPHGRTSEEYKELLDGGPLPPALPGPPLQDGQLRLDVDSQGVEPRACLRGRGAARGGEGVRALHDLLEPEEGDDDSDAGCGGDLVLHPGFNLEEELDALCDAEGFDAWPGPPTPLAVEPDEGPGPSTPLPEELWEGPGPPTPLREEREEGPGPPSPLPEEPDEEPLGPPPPPPPPPHHAPVLGRRLRAGRTEHPVFFVDVRGDGKAHLRHDTKLKKLAAHCGLERHGKRCRIQRALTAGRNPDQGRPAGLLLQWMAIAEDFDDADAHMQVSREPTVFFDPRFRHELRVQKRAWAEDDIPGFMAWICDKERFARPGEPREPEGLT